ncbi:MAG: hypothetical protein GSR85_07985 [Desulfurococcales archaeon]|nr:hypothetical protein [Desulfurococcales archaeon]
MKRPYIDEVVIIRDNNTVVINGIGKPKILRLSREVVSWISNSYAARRVIEELVTHYKFRSRLSHPGAIRSLIILLYARARGEAPYRVARRVGVAHEQLYRLERGLKRDGLYDFVINLLSLES